MLDLLTEDREYVSWYVVQAQVTVLRARVSAGMPCDAVPKEFFSVYAPNLIEKIFWKKGPHEMHCLFS